MMEVADGFKCYFSKGTGSCMLRGCLLVWWWIMDFQGWSTRNSQSHACISFIFAFHCHFETMNGAICAAVAAVHKSFSKSCIVDICCKW